MVYEVLGESSTSREEGRVLVELVVSLRRTRLCRQAANRINVALGVASGRLHGDRIEAS